MNHHRRQLTWLAALALLLAAAPGRGAEAPQVVLAEETHDFGEIWEGEPVSYEFPFRNAGGAPLLAKGG